MKLNSSSNTQSIVPLDFKALESSNLDYQNEKELENELIKDLQNEGYEYAGHIKNEKDLMINLRAQLERLNEFQFSDKGWQEFYTQHLCNVCLSAEDKIRQIQQDARIYYQNEQGKGLNIKLVDKEHLEQNALQIVHQFENSDEFHNRYDVTLLVNGLPLVHIELKRRGVSLKEAFYQIKRYQRESFSAHGALFEYIQVFIISNGTKTKYFSALKHALNYKDTIFFTDIKNKPILDLRDFTRAFLKPHVLLNVLFKFCVFNVKKELLILRPYQIAACEAILSRVKQAHLERRWGTKEAGGYIWHTTGSGKTLSSFKSAQLVSALPFIKKVIFVVDRKDLDNQSVKEFNQFEANAVNANKNTKALQKSLENGTQKLVVTTIQKLANFCKFYEGHALFDEEIVFIFDECHRSQFGLMHELIKEKFKRYYLFGFTGTPIFSENANKSNVILSDEQNTHGQKRASIATTQGIFGQRLHSYTLVSAIRDGAVLPFRVEYLATLKAKEHIKEEQIFGIDKDKLFLDERRLGQIVSYVLEHFDKKTNKGRFNSIFAVQNIEFAKAYYKEFQRQMKALEPQKRLKVALIYSYAPNEAVDEEFLEDESLDESDKMSASSKEFLAGAIKDYNRMFQSNFDAGTGFEDYYKNLSERMKRQEIDILIVVDMFLTGFDAKRLNTLWVDKELRMHGLLQAFSRTNRTFDAVKSFGNVVCFRNLQNAVNESLALFGDESNADKVVLLRSFEEYIKGYKDEKGDEITGYEELIRYLMSEFSLETLKEQGEGLGAENKKFIQLFGKILKLENILKCFDEFNAEEFRSQRLMQDYESFYKSLYEQMGKNNQKEPINEDVEFEIELLKANEVSVEFILYLIKEKRGDKKQLKISLEKHLNASNLKNKKDLILKFIENLNELSGVEEQFKEYIKQERQKELSQIIVEFNLVEDKAQDFMQRAFKFKDFSELGVGFNDFLPPISLFDKSSKKENIIHALRFHYDRFIDLSLAAGL